MMFILLIILVLIDNSHSFEWNCMKNQSNSRISHQCTILVEYLSSYNQEKHLCLTHSLSIQTLPTLSFSSNYTMKIFQINYCQLLTLNQLPFTLPSSVEILDLSFNLLTTFTLAFPLPSYLKSINLNSNPNLKQINFGHTRVQENLIHLSLRHNKYMQLTFLPENLIQLDLTNCNLSQSSILTLLKSVKKLTHLSLGENQLEQLPILDENIQLEYLNLSNNHLTLTDNRWLLYKQIKIFDLSFNHIKSLEFLHEKLELNNHDDPTANHTLQLSLHGNPLICDCWFGSILESPSINITDLSLLECNSRSILNISYDDLLCPYSRHCTTDCQCCEFEACDCHSICPSECLCAHNIQWSHHLIKCQEQNLSSIHMFLPETVTELNYEENYIEQIKPFVFIGKKLLTKLNLAKNNLRDLTNDTFCSAINLQEINLSYNPNLMTILPNINELFACLKSLESIILSKEQINEDEQISDGWTVESNKDLIHLIRITKPSQILFSSSSSVSSSLTVPTMTSLYESTEPSTILSIYHQESYTSSNILQYNQTLIIIIFFLLFFVLLFLLLLISLAICRRKLRQHLTNEIERQRSQQYYYYHHHHTNLQQPSIKTTEINNGINGANDSLYEQLPSISSDSEQPFLYNEKQINNTNPPALPPYPPMFRHYHCYHPHEYQYTINTSTKDCAQPSVHQYSSVLLLGNQIRYPNLSEYCLSKQHDNNSIHYCKNDTIFVPTTVCTCHNQRQINDIYVSPNVHR